jgi:FkbM family methyltransferase
MMRHIQELTQTAVRFGEEDGTPWIESGKAGIRFYGFWSGEAEHQQIFAMGDVLPGGVEPEYFRLAKDFITRFIYPHMRPDMHPDGIGPDNWWGFHGQHKQPLSVCRGIKETVLRREFSPRRGQIIIDGGAFTGMGAIHMARVVGPEGRVIAVEAAPDCYALLNRNVAHNAVNNVVALHRAMWREDTIMDLELGAAQANKLIRKTDSGARCLRVRTACVDGIVRELGLKRLDMISLTINGAELEGLEGAGRTLDDLRPRLRLAGWYQRSGETIWRQAAKMLKCRKYAVATSPRGDVLAVPTERLDEV